MGSVLLSFNDEFLENRPLKIAKKIHEISKTLKSLIFNAYLYPEMTILSFKEI